MEGPIMESPIMDGRQYIVENVFSGEVVDIDLVQIQLYTYDRPEDILEYEGRFGRDSRVQSHGREHYMGRVWWRRK